MRVSLEFPTNRFPIDNRSPPAHRETTMRSLDRSTEGASVTEWAFPYGQGGYIKCRRLLFSRNPLIWAMT
jgi:hypothetical protein